MNDPHPLAERRYAYAQACVEDGDFAAAAEIFEQALELSPRWSPAWFALAQAREKQGFSTQAAFAYREALTLDPADVQGAGPRLARLEGRPADALPPAYVARLFDDYAPRFDAHLTRALGYRGPELILAALDAAAPGRRFARALDLGCGSGLMGRALKGRVAWLGGVDLSPGMVAKAREAGVYDELAVGELHAYLAAQPPGAADLVVAADTLVYLGDLAPVLRAAAAALSPDGVLAFTVESDDAAPFALGEGLRFRHSDGHLREAASAAAVQVVHLAAVATRREAGVDVAGRVIVARKTAG